MDTPEKSFYAGRNRKRQGQGYCLDVAMDWLTDQGLPDHTANLLRAHEETHLDHFPPGTLIEISAKSWSDHNGFHVKIILETDIAGHNPKDFLAVYEAIPRDEWSTEDHASYTLLQNWIANG